MQSKRYHIVLASVLFAGLMWVSVNMGDEYQVSMDIPLVVRDVPEGKAIKGTVPRSVTIRVRGQGWQLASMLLSGKPECALSAAALEGTTSVVTQNDLLRIMNLPAGIQPVDVNIDDLVLGLDQFAERKVPVIPNVGIECPEGFGMVGAPNVKPESVLVTGAESVIRRIRSWGTERHVFSNVRESFTVEVPLEESGDNSFQVVEKSVMISAAIQQLAEKIFPGLPVGATSIPPSREIIFIPPRVDVVARGGIDQLASLSDRDFKLVVEYESLLTDTTGYVNPRVESPPGIRILAQRPERLQYIIRKRL